MPQLWVGVIRRLAVAATTLAVLADHDHDGRERVQGSPQPGDLQGPSGGRSRNCQQDNPATACERAREVPHDRPLYAATVRGTNWTMTARCDGTLTHVITDSVIV